MDLFLITTLNRQLHKVGKFVYELFEIVSSFYKNFCSENRIS